MGHSSAAMIDFEVDFMMMIEYKVTISWAFSYSGLFVADCPLVVETSLGLMNEIPLLSLLLFWRAFSKT